MMYHLRFFTVLLLALSVSGKSLANDKTVLAEQSIKSFYSDLVEAKIAGGEYLISFHKKHFHDDLRLILNLERSMEGNVLPKAFLDHDKKTLMDAIISNTKIINHKEGHYNVLDFSIGEDGRSAQVHVTLLSKFIVQVEKLAPQRDGFEKMDCQDRLVISDSDMVQVISSQCNVNVSLARKQKK